MLGVPESSGLGCGVTGVLERVRAIGPTHLLDLRVGERTIEVRWEWDLNPPEPDSVIGIAVTPGTLRFFNEPNAPRPAASAAPEEPLVAAPPPPEGESDLRADAATEPAESLSSRYETTSEDDLSVEDLPPSGAAAVTPSSARAQAEVREFRPSEGLMAEPPPPRNEPAPVAYDPEDVARNSGGYSGGGVSGAGFSGGGLSGGGIVASGFLDRGAPAPAPSPPRTQDEGTSDEHEVERSVELMPPWLQVSRPAGDDPERPPEDPHRGMPLD
jgi:hypothetical protein